MCVSDYFCKSKRTGGKNTMKKKQGSVWKLVKRAVEVEVDMKNLGWPPDCCGFLYQPQRPEKKSKKEN